jgi:hypothetical protein
LPFPFLILIYGSIGLYFNLYQSVTKKFFEQYWFSESFYRRNFFIGHLNFFMKIGLRFYANGGNQIEFYLASAIFKYYFDTGQRIQYCEWFMFLFSHPCPLFPLNSTFSFFSFHSITLKTPPDPSYFHTFIYCPFYKISFSSL